MIYVTFVQVIFVPVIVNVIICVVKLVILNYLKAADELLIARPDGPSYGRMSHVFAVRVDLPAVIPDPNCSICTRIYAI